MQGKTPGHTHTSHSSHTSRRRYPSTRADADFGRPRAMATEEEILFECASARVTKRGAHFQIRALGGASVPLDDGTVAAVLQIAQRLLDAEVPFATTWDIVDCSVPSLQIVARCTRWALAHRARLNRLNTRLAVALPGERRALKAIAQTVLALVGPPCPTLITQSREEAANFMSL